MQFGHKLGMIKVFISKNLSKPKEIEVDYCFENLGVFCDFFINKKKMSR